MTTNILLWRHGPHGGNVLTAEAIALLSDAGRKLSRNALTPDLAYSSPVVRAVASAIEIMTGAGKVTTVTMDVRLGDIASDTLMPLDTMAQVQKAAMELCGVVDDASMVKALAVHFEGHMVRRAKEGAAALREIADLHQGQNVLVVSHGAARIEVALRELKYGDTLPARQLLDVSAAVTPMGCGYLLIMQDGVLIGHEPIGWDGPSAI